MGTKYPMLTKKISLGCDVPMKLWKLIEMPGGATKAKELLLKRCQLHKNENQQVFAAYEYIKMDTGYRLQNFKYKYLWSRAYNTIHIFNIH